MQRSGGALPEVDPRLVDGVLAVGMALAVAVLVAAELEGTERTGPGAYLFAAGFGGLMLLRRRFPVGVLAVTVPGVFVYYILGFPPIGIALPAVAALYSAAEQDRTRWAVGAGAVLVVVAAYYRIEEGQPAEYLYGYELLTNVALVAAAVALGVAVRVGRESRQRAEQVRVLTAAEQARVVESQLQAERMRIARDLHDVVGHTMSVISVHSAVAAEAVGRDDGAAREALERVREAASSTMRELRATVKVLRGPAAAEPGRGTTGLAGVGDLARAAGQAGLEVDVASGSRRVSSTAPSTPRPTASSRSRSPTCSATPPPAAPRSWRAWRTGGSACG
ncbi:sensor histidine kinase [Georgenia sp. SUBG003]|uniref:sensor histidine kinase n=1 Tax=Georgenia sp. SUBG003 TaxID=1497974 RepID=UPI003AB25A2B